MYKIRTPYILLAAFITFNFYSCVPQKKVSVVKQQLSQQDSLLLNYNKNLVSLDEKRQKKAHHLSAGNVTKHCMSPGCG